MTSNEGEKFGATVRREREKLEIGLREMAKKIGVSPTYISKVERDEFPPPAEDKVIAIAKILDRDPDELLALAGKVRALLEGRYNVSFEDVRRVFLPAMRHRVLLNFEAQAEGIEPDKVLLDILEKVPEKGD